MKFSESAAKIESKMKETEFSTNINQKNNGTFSGHKYKKSEEENKKG